MQCETVSLQLAEIADGLTALDPQSQKHVNQCLRCQAELAQYRKLLRALNAMRGHQMVPDERLLDEILEALRPPATVHRFQRRNRRVAYLGGIAAAATAGAAGAIVIATRLANRQSLAS